MTQPLSTFVSLDTTPRDHVISRCVGHVSLRDVVYQRICVLA